MYHYCICSVKTFPNQKYHNIVTLEITETEQRLPACYYFKWSLLLVGMLIHVSRVSWIHHLNVNSISPPNWFEPWSISIQLLSSTAQVCMSIDQTDSDCWSRASNLIFEGKMRRPTGSDGARDPQATTPWSSSTSVLAEVRRFPVWKHLTPQSHGGRGRGLTLINARCPYSSVAITPSRCHPTTITGSPSVSYHIVSQSGQSS